MTLDNVVEHGRMKLLHPLSIALASSTILLSTATQALAQLPTSDPAQPRFSCLTGYPDGTFGGDRPVTRNEFAAGLNACLEQVQQLQDNRLATQEEFEATLQRQQELNDALDSLSDRVEGSFPLAPEPSPQP